MLAKKTKKLYDIDPKTWEHPADKGALAALRNLQGFDEISKFLFSKTSEQSLRLIHIASAARVTKDQFSYINNTIDRVVDTFDWPYRPDVFVTQSPFFNAGVYGVKEPFIVLNSSIVSQLDDNEIACVVAHEMGHIMSGHAVYKTLLWLLLNVSLKLMPMGELILMPIIAALREWDKKSELSADRAKLLGTQNEVPCYAVLMKMAGGNDLSQLNVNEFFAQAEEYENRKSVLDGIHKILAMVWETHPFPVVRLKELHTWAVSGHYAAILEGNYIKRGFHTPDPTADIRGGFEFYKNEFEKNDDSFSNAAKTLGEGLSKLGENIEDALRGVFKNK